ncbi:MAG: hypothetical protein KA771_00655 [Spirochaetales bacterium]|nr:hypothetical protein [Spirochaetales bacterium]
MQKRQETFDNETYTYHYNREERLQKNPRVRSAFYDDSGCHSLPCFFMQNRGLMFFLMDLGFLLILFWAYQTFFGFSKSELEMNGFHISLYAYEYGEGTLISFKARATQDIPEGMEGIPVTFLLGTEQKEAFLDLPMKNGEEKVLRVSFPLRKMKKAKAIVVFIDKSYSLITNVQKSN